MPYSAVPIELSEPDARVIFQALHRAITTGRFIRGRVGTLETLKRDLEGATIVSPERLARDAVALGSTVDIEDLRTGSVLRQKLVTPEQADPRAGCLSVLSPLGAAVLGHRQGETITYESAEGEISVKVRSVSRA